MNVLIDVAIHDASLAQLRQMPGVQVRLAPNHDQEVEHVLPGELLQDVEVLICSYLPQNHQDLRRLRYLQISSAGYEHIINHNLPARGVAVCNAAGVFDTAIAEWNVMMMIALARNLVGLLDHQRAKVWDRDAMFQREIRGSTVGFWGYGGLARATARLCKTLGMTVHTLTRNGPQPRPDKFVEPGAGDPEGTLPDRDFRLDDRFSFLKGLDFLIMATPLTPATRGMVGEAELRALPAHALLLNPARGPLIQEQALLRALGERWFAGAALDTHYAYPLPPEHPLWSMPNVMLTPHISGSDGSPFYRQRLWRIFLENLRRRQAGAPLLNRLSDAALTPA